MTLPGQHETRLPDGRRMVSAVRVIEDGARGVLLLEPGRFRVDATPAPDMFRVAVRTLVDGGDVVSRHRDRPLTTLASHGIDQLDLPLLGSAALTVVWDGREEYAVQLATVRDPERGTTTFTVQAMVGLAGFRDGC